MSASSTGASMCRYIITWDNSPSVVLKKIRYIMLSTLTVGNIGIFATTNWELARYVAPISLLVGIAYTLIAKDRELRELKKTYGLPSVHHG